MLTYKIEALGQGVIPRAINSAGTVVGGGPGFIWDLTNKLRPLPAVVGSPVTGNLAFAINDAGTVVGKDVNNESAALVWQDGTKPPVALAAPASVGSVAAFAAAINRYGLIGGGAYDFLPASFARAVIWSGPPEQPTEIGQSRVGIQPTILGLNSASPAIAVGGSFLRNDQAFAVSTEDLSQIVLLADVGSSANAVNDAGRIVGNVNDVPAIFDINGNVTLLALPASFNAGKAFAVNAPGHIVGFMSNGAGTAKAFLFAPSYIMSPQPVVVSQALIDLLGQIGVPGFGGGGGANYIPGPWQVVALEDLIDPKLGWQLAEATGINDAGQIVGVGELNGVAHGFIMTPERHSGSSGQAIIETVIMIMFGGRLGAAGWGVDASGHVVPIPGDNPEMGANLTAARSLAAAALIYETARLLVDADTANVIKLKASTVMRRSIALLTGGVGH